MMKFSAFSWTVTILIDCDIIKGGAYMVTLFVEQGIIQAIMGESFEGLASAAEEWIGMTFDVNTNTITPCSIPCNESGYHWGILGLMGNHQTNLG